MLKLIQNQAGDTIVEVLIAIVVVSMVLVAGYITTTRSIDGMQETQEHSEGLQLAQSQLEYLHDSSSVPAANQCFDSSDAIVGGTNCVVDSSGCILGTTGCPPTTVEPQFKIAINQVHAATYSVAVTWQSLVQSKITDNVTLYYQP